MVYLYNVGIIHIKVTTRFRIIVAVPYVHNIVPIYVGTRYIVVQLNFTFERHRLDTFAYTYGNNMCMDTKTTTG